MDLRCLMPHKAGRKISVNGRQYEIGSDLIVRDVEAEDVAKMLQGSYEAMDTPKAKAEAKPAPAPKEEASEPSEDSEDAPRSFKKRKKSPSFKE